jgi:hypothetical protein
LLSRRDSDSHKRRNHKTHRFELLELNTGRRCNTRRSGISLYGFMLVLANLRQGCRDKHCHQRPESESTRPSVCPNHEIPSCARDRRKTDPVMGTRPHRMIESTEPPPSSMKTLKVETRLLQRSSARLKGLSAERLASKMSNHESGMGQLLDSAQVGVNPQIIAGPKSAWGKCDSTDCGPSSKVLEARFWIASGWPGHIRNPL